MRRRIAIAIVLLPVVLLVASIIAPVAPSWPRAGFVFTVLGLLVSGMNAWLSIRPKREHHVSGAPLIGTLLVIVGGALAFGSAAIAALGLVAYAIDTGGIFWFVVSVWTDKSFWE